MNKYTEKVDKIVGLFLQAEENCETIEVILDSDLAYDVAVTLQDELGKNFFYESDEDNFDYLLKNNDILGITLVRYNTGVIYFLEETVYNGITLEGEMDTFYIQDYLIDCLDLDRLHGNIVILKELEEEETNEEYSVENELDEIFEEIVENVIQEIDESESDEEFCLHCTIKDAVQEAYLFGYRKAQEMLRDALNENLDSMDY